MMKFLLTLLIGVVAIVASGLLVRTVYELLTFRKRKDLEAAADLEYAEYMETKRALEESSFTFMGRTMSDDERKRREHMQTDAGRELIRLEELGKWFFIIGAMIAIVAFVVYLRFN